MRLLIRFLCMFFLWSNLTLCYADEALVRDQNTQTFIKMMVNQYQFDRKQLVAILTEAKFQPQIIASMERPYEKKTWDVYKALFLTDQRLQAGLEFWKKNEKALAKAQAIYGVPAEIIVAIIGVETLYGKNQGNYRVLDALTTLAFYYPTRSEFFTKEFREFLLLCREHGVPATQYLGSYAGAMGKPQFMPSSYRFYAVDFTGNGKVDLMQNDHDVIGSVANYFHKHGWTQSQYVAQPVDVHGASYQRFAMNSKVPDYSFQQLTDAGIKPIGPVFAHPEQAGLIELLTQNGSEYWVAYPNFYVITRYNTSPQYALVVYLLSQQLRKAKQV